MCVDDVIRYQALRVHIAVHGLHAIQQFTPMVDAIYGHAIKHVPSMVDRG